MTFKVDVAALAGYAAQLGRAGEDARECRRYFAANAGDVSSGAGGLINPLRYEHAGVRDRVDGVLAHLVDVLERSRAELTAAAQRYRATDRTAADEMDASYPVAGRPAARKG